MTLSFTTYQARSPSIKAELPRSMFFCSPMTLLNIRNSGRVGPLETSCYTQSELKYSSGVESKLCSQPTALIDRTLGIKFGRDIRAANDMRCNTSSLQRFLQLA